MTRAEFVDSVTTWWELRDFCDDIRCDIMDGFMDSDSREEYIDESLVDMARNNTWREMLDALKNYDDESGYDSSDDEDEDEDDEEYLTAPPMPYVDDEEY